jgi:2-polyprenyl-6-methoxyphenol hydroxylase-like FAD-dependent oxidoreductase
MQRLRIALCGAGTAGLASAIILARQGHDITLFEQTPTMETVGAGILLQPTGMAVFEHLGVLEEARDLGAHVTALRGRLANNTLLIDSRYHEACPDHHGLGLHRATLCHVLMQALRPLPVQWRFGCTTIRVQDHGVGAELVYRDASDERGGEHSATFDLVLVANGARSTLRPTEWVALDKPYPWGAVWAILPECEALDTQVLHQFFHGASRMMGILPTGAVPEARGQRLTSLFWSLPTAELEKWGQNAGAIAAWKSEVRQRWPSAGEWIESLDLQPGQFLPAHYRDVVMKRFGAGRIGVLGDAAHAMSPQLGQGVNMALLDAWALGQALQQSNDLTTMWAEYHRLRLPSVRFYQFMSRGLTPFYQSHSRLLGLLRDISFPWMYRLPWLRREMARTVSGVKAGPFRETSLATIAANPADPALLVPQG